MDKFINFYIFNDFYFKFNVKGLILKVCDSSLDCYEFILFFFFVVMEVDENVEVMKVDLIDDKCNFGLGMIMRVIDIILLYV